MRIMAGVSAVVVAVLFTGRVAPALPSFSDLSELQAERNPSKRSEKALALAESHFESARTYYDRNEIKKGDEQLEQMSIVLTESLNALQSQRKAINYKKAELRVVTLQHRMKSLLDDLSVDDRGWAEYTERKLDELHDALLAGVMKK